jgi:uroporphyrinogen III methyltransferase/synthase
MTMSTVLITRPAHQADSLKTQLEELGYRTLIQPAIEFQAPESRDDIDATIQKLRNAKTSDIDWIIFSSSNGVHFFFNLLNEPGTLAPELSELKIAVVGSGTNETLRQRLGRNTDVLPDRFSAEDLADKLRDEAALGKHFVLFRADKGRDVLRQKLTEYGGQVSDIVLYRSVNVKQAFPEIRCAVESGNVDYITVTSSEIAVSLAAMFQEYLRKMKIVSISPLTSRKLESLGFPPHYEAATASMDGIAEVFYHLSKGRM